MLFCYSIDYIMKKGWRNCHSFFINLLGISFAIAYAKPLHFSFLMRTGAFFLVTSFASQLHQFVIMCIMTRAVEQRIFVSTVQNHLLFSHSFSPHQNFSGPLFIVKRKALFAVSCCFNKIIRESFR